MVDQLTTSRLILRPPQLADVEKLERFDTQNKAHLSPWEPLITTSAKERLRLCRQEIEEGRSVRFFLFLQESPEEIIGGCNFTQIFRGAFHACYLGFRVDAAFEGQGLMAEALRRTIQYMFEDQNLHRIMANYIQRNERSRNLLYKLGFKKEGEAKDYLYINGKWEDHILTALTNTNWKLLR